MSILFNLVVFVGIGWGCLQFARFIETLHSFIWLLDKRLSAIEDRSPPIQLFEE